MAEYIHASDAIFLRRQPDSISGDLIYDGVDRVNGQRIIGLLETVDALEVRLAATKYALDAVVGRQSAGALMDLATFRTEVAAALTTLEHALRPDLFRTAEFHQAAMEIIRITREQLGLATGKDGANFSQ